MLMIWQHNGSLATAGIYLKVRVRKRNSSVLYFCCFYVFSNHANDLTLHQSFSNDTALHILSGPDCLL